MAEQPEDGVTIQMRGYRKSFHTPVLSKDLSRMSADKLPEAAYELHGLIAKYCGILAETLYTNPKRQEELFARLQAARKEIDEPKDQASQVFTLNKVIFEVHRIHTIIAKDLEFTKQTAQMSWISPIIALVYILTIIGIIIFGWEQDEKLMIPMIGIPLSVLAWSLIGSVAAILYRFYNYQIQDLSQIRSEVTWLIARPLTGTLMGMLSYVIIAAGLFGSGGEVEAELSKRWALLWVIAFLAGFSDKFYKGFINTLVNKLSGAASESPSSTDGR